MVENEKKYDIIVVGAGHAGCEAALAAARMGCETLLLTINLDTIAQMSCNPAIGGLAKGHLVKEIDALGGEMAKNIDKTGIQFRRLNMTKGPAVRASRAQADKKAYQLEMKNVLELQEHLDMKQAIVEEILCENNKVIGVGTKQKVVYSGRAVILANGTFLKGTVHIGEVSFTAGRLGEPAAEKLSDSLRELGFETERLSTSTPPRVNKRTINFDALQIQSGDENPRPFSFSNDSVTQEQMPCYLTYTNKKVHQIIRDNLHRSSISKEIVETGPRYCPSIEEKVVKFADKERHHIFVEPEGRNTSEYYLNGLFTGLPQDVQLKTVHNIDGLEDAHVMRPAYAIEYDFMPATQLKPTLETKSTKNLYFSGQINGTSGYEEAAAQGLIAGINAVRKLRREDPIILARSQAYIGVLIDDLVTKVPKEPYRMFTSRAEYRLVLREDNADLRLREIGHAVGLVDDETYRRFRRKKKQIEDERERLENVVLKPDEAMQEKMRDLGTTKLTNPTSLAKLLRRPEIEYTDIKNLLNGKGTDLNGQGCPLYPSELSEEAAEEVEIQVKYEGYIKRQEEQIEKFKKLESKKIPEDFYYEDSTGLRLEAKEKLAEIRPASIGQASRIPGVSPADISVLMILLRKHLNSKK